MGEIVGIGDRTGECPMVHHGIDQINWNDQNNRTNCKLESGKSNWMCNKSETAITALSMRKMLLVDHLVCILEV